MESSRTIRLSGGTRRRKSKTTVKKMSKRRMNGGARKVKRASKRSSKSRKTSRKSSRKSKRSNKLKGGNPPGPVVIDPNTNLAYGRPVTPNAEHAPDATKNKTPLPQQPKPVLRAAPK